MTVTPATDLLRDILALCLQEDMPPPLLLVSASPARQPGGAGQPRFRQVTPADIESGLAGVNRSDVAVVIGQLEHLSGDAGMQMLAKLRDVYCDRIIVHTTLPTPTAQDMLSIGFYPETRWEGHGRLFRYSREEFYPGRDWNTPENWANPANFGKNRW